MSNLEQFGHLASPLFRGHPSLYSAVWRGHARLKLRDGVENDSVVIEQRPHGIARSALFSAEQTGEVFPTCSHVNAQTWQHQASTVSKDFGPIEQRYIVSDRSQVLTLLRAHRHLAELLLEAVPYLHSAFGDSLLRLSVAADDDDRGLKVSVLWLGDLKAAEDGLSAFDDSWWLDNCARSQGYLEFNIAFA